MVLADHLGAIGALGSDVIEFLQPINIQQNLEQWNARSNKHVTKFFVPTKGAMRVVFAEGSFYFIQRPFMASMNAALPPIFTVNEVGSGYLVKRVLANADDEVLVCADDLAELSAMESPVLHAPEFRALLFKQVRSLTRDDFNRIPNLTDDEYLAILRGRKDMDNEVLAACSRDKKNIRSRVIAAYILDRLGSLSKTRLDDLLGKISVSLKTKQNIRNRCKILLAMYPNCLLSQTQHTDSQHVEAVCDALRDGFQQEGLL